MGRRGGGGDIHRVVASISKNYSQLVAQRDDGVTEERLALQQCLSVLLGIRLSAPWQQNVCGDKIQSLVVDESHAPCLLQCWKVELQRNQTLFVINIRRLPVCHVCV